MSLDIHVDMSDESLTPFRTAWQQATLRTSATLDCGLIAAAREHRADIAERAVAPFLQSHLAAVDEAIAFLDDRRWDADGELLRALQGALAYFVDPVDLIPDTQPQFGLLDDAIVLELAIKQHPHEWTAWREFTRFRQDYPQFDWIDRRQWMSLRQEELALVLRHRRRSLLDGRRQYSNRSDLAPFVVH